MGFFRLACAARDAVLADRLEIARSFFSRMRGLLGRKELPVGEGLFLVPCDAIHMFGMRFPIDAVFVDAEMRVLEVFADLPIGATASRSGANGVIELPAGTTARCGVREGDQLTMSEIE